MLMADTPGMSDIARHMEGSFRRREKTVEGFLHYSDPKESLQTVRYQGAERIHLAVIGEHLRDRLHRQSGLFR